MNRTVGRESDPEEAGRDKDSANLTHDKPEFWPDGTVLLDFLKHKPTRTHQLHGKERATCLIPVPKWLR